MKPFRPIVAAHIVRAWAQMPTAGEVLADRLERRIATGRCQRNHHRIRVRLLGRLTAYDRTALSLELMKRGYSPVLFTTKGFSTFVTIPAGALPAK